MKKGFLLPVIAITLAMVVSQVSSQSRSAETTEMEIVTLPLEQYRSHQNFYGPIDRLFLMDGLIYYLQNTTTTARSGAFPNRFSPAHPVSLPLPMPAASSNGNYHSYLETVEMLDELAATHPGFARTFSIGSSVEGRELKIIKISDHVELNEAEPNIFIVGCHHAREWISVEIPLLFAQYLLENRDADQQVARAVTGAQIYIIPLLNPDGLEFSIHTYRLWRKNRQYNDDLIWGVDLNRNYSEAWGYDDIGSSSDPWSGVYRGPSPFSEPETMAVRDFLLANPPSASLSYHNYSQLILYPWGYTEAPAPDAAEMDTIARTMAEHMFNESGRIYEYGPGATTIYPTNGDSDDWIYATFGAYAFTVELPPELFIEGGFFTTQELIDSAFAEQLPAMLYFVNYFIP